MYSAVPEASWRLRTALKRCSQPVRLDSGFDDLPAATWVPELKVPRHAR